MKKFLFIALLAIGTTAHAQTAPNLSQMSEGEYIKAKKALRERQQATEKLNADSARWARSQRIAHGVLRDLKNSK